MKTDITRVVFAVAIIGAGILIAAAAQAGEQAPMSQHPAVLLQADVSALKLKRSLDPQTFIVAHPARLALSNGHAGPCAAGPASTRRWRCSARRSRRGSTSTPTSCSRRARRSGPWLRQSTRCSWSAWTESRSRRRPAAGLRGQGPPPCSARDLSAGFRPNEGPRPALRGPTRAGSRYTGSPGSAGAAWPAPRRPAAGRARSPSAR